MPQNSRFKQSLFELPVHKEDQQLNNKHLAEATLE